MTQVVLNAAPAGADGNRAARGQLRRHALVVLNQGAYSAGTLAVTIAVARALSAADFGRFAAIAAFVTLFQSLNIAVLLNSMLILGGTTDYEKARVFTAGSIVQLLMVVGSAFLLGATVVIFDAVTPVIGATTYILPSVFLLAAVQSYDFTRRGYFLWGWTWSAIVLDTSRTFLCPLALLVTEIYRGQIDLRSVLWIVAWVHVLLATSGAWALRRSWVRISGLRGQISVYGTFAWNSVGVVGAWVSGNALTFLTAQSLGPAAVGIWRMIYQLSAPIHMVSQGLVSDSAVKFGDAVRTGGIPELQVAAKHQAMFLVGATTVVALPACIFSDQVLGVVFGMDLSGHRIAVLLLVVATLLVSAGALIELGLQACGRHRAAATSSVIGIICLLAAGIILVPRFGLVGTAGAAAVGAAAQLAVLLFCFGRLQR